MLDEMAELDVVRGAAVIDQLGEIVGSVGDVDTPPESPDFKADRALVYGGGDVEDMIGRLVVVVDSGPLWEALGERLKIDALILVVMAATLVGVNAFGARIVIVRPIKRFRAAVDRLRPENIRQLAQDSDGSNISPTRTGIKEGDEIGELARAFESMADELQKSHVESDPISLDTELA